MQLLVSVGEKATIVIEGGELKAGCHQKGVPKKTGNECSPKRKRAVKGGGC